MGDDLGPVPDSSTDSLEPLFDRASAIAGFIYYRRLLMNTSPFDPWSPDDRQGLHDMLNFIEAYLLADMELIEACRKQLTHDELCRLVSEKLNLTQGRLPGHGSH